MDRRKVQQCAAFMIFVGGFLCQIPHAFASGFAIYTQGASSLGQSAATVAHTDDPSTIFFNPALMNRLEGTQAQIGTTLLFPEREFKDPSGQTFRTKNDIFYPSTFYITHKFNEKVSVGLGVFNPFGLGSDWGRTWEGRYIATKSELHTYNVNPVVSYRPIPGLSLAAGFEYLIIDAKLQKNINLAAITGVPGFPDAGQTFKGDGHGVGYNFGLALDVTKDITFGASYRSRIRGDIDGTATNDLPQVTPAMIVALLPNTSGSTKINFPQQFMAGIAYKGFDRLTFEIGMRWEGWSSFKELRIDLDHPILGQSASITPRQWKDTYAFDIGAKYKISDAVSLLAGYLYSGTPVPDKTFDPTIPDANTNLFTAGASFKYKRCKFDLAYGFQTLQDRQKNNTVGDPITGVSMADGKYSSHLHIIGTTATYQF